MTTATPPKLLAARYAMAATAIASATALTVGLAAPAVAATNVAHPTGAVAADTADPRYHDIELAAALGIYPTGPLFQAARLAGAGSLPAALNTLGVLSGLLPGEVGDSLEGIVGQLAGILGPVLEDGVGLDLRVPQMGPYGVLNAVNSLDGSGTLFSKITVPLALSTIKTALILAENGDLLSAALEPILNQVGLGSVAGLFDTISELPLNVPGTEIRGEGNFGPFGDVTIGAFLADVENLAVIPTVGLGGTALAIVSPKLLEDKDTAVLAIPIRNSSRPGGGLIALLNPLGQLVGITLSNVDGRGNPKVTTDVDGTVGEGDDQIGVSASATEFDGNLTY